MKTIYFVRHGESEGNVGHIRQTADTPLTDEGRRQAVTIADRAARLDFECIVSSTMERARQTASPILERTAKPIEYSELFAERRRPSEVIGKPKNNPLSMHAERTVEQQFAVPGFRFSDEENFDDLKTRAGKALTYLMEREEDNILVVTHGFFMRILVAYAFFGEELTGRECERFIRALRMKNTGITVLTYNHEDAPGRWVLKTWNDHAHLG